MLQDHLIARLYIKTARYLFGQKFMKVMAGPLRGYRWTTRSSYEYIIGNYEDPAVLETFCSWLKPNTVFYDLGGNVGFYAILANRFITEGKIYSFEPLPAVRAVFEKHLAINQKLLINNNISILPFAIADEEREISFSNNAKQQDGNTYIKGSSVYAAAKDIIWVKAFPIDGLLQKGYEPPDIIKIDVEGAEYDVLCGAVNTLQQYKPNILLATHDCHLPGVKDKCIDLLQELGYIIKHTGHYNKQVEGLDDYIAVHPVKQDH